MPWDVNGRWIPEDDSVVTRLTGLLADDSTYMQTARAAGARTAARRGLLNSSIAAGAAESAAIAAGAPLASQDAQQTFQRNQAVLEGGISLDTNTKLEAQRQAGALEQQRQDFEGRGGLMGLEAQFQKDRDLLLAQGATEAQIREFDARAREQAEAIASSERQALLGAETNIRQTQISATSSLSANYLNAFSQLAGDPNIPANVRNAYIAEFQRILTQGQALIGVTQSVPLTWGPVQSSPTTVREPVPVYNGATSGGGTGMVYDNGAWRPASVYA